MAEYRLTPRALYDLDAIADYSLDRWGPRQTEDYLRQLADRFQWLAENPSVAHTRDDVADGYRSFPEGKHVIFYLVMSEEEIAAIGVPHSAMDVTADRFT
ncbi:type II toxin-antitoxin system RelE/ParE family toxin [uncultured Tateyamaria sp.]|uniref:type II toxin-antitoxin system RelE/ParE family toxin n=1 Tax=uncultured Tateyamaria sp. TaxID=455651 RepID=UPI002619D5E8|nr:type II toxin-antitoxin system RelE/ParE family toxin [uncultured Tateyamaria sp.]